MNQKIRFGFYILTMFFFALFFSHIVHSSLSIFIILSITIFLIFLYKIIKGKNKITKKHLKQLIPYFFLIMLTSGLDLTSTYFFVIDKGIENELNLVFKFVYNNIGNYAFLLMPFFTLSIIFFCSLYLLRQYNLKTTKKFIIIMCCLDCLVVVYNFIT